MNKLVKASWAMVAGAVLVHFIVTGVLFVEPQARSLARLGAAPAWERSAVLVSPLLRDGDVFAPYVRFLRESVPEGSVLIMPFVTRAGRYDQLGFMQYFLFPRDLDFCNVKDIPACISAREGEDIWILSLPDFPAEGLTGVKAEEFTCSRGRGVFHVIELTDG